jgi:hypothetical protein
MSETWPPPDQLYANEKPGIRYYLILAALPLLPLELDRQTYHQEALEIRKNFDDKMKYAIAQEVQGNRIQAISICEQLIEQACDEIYPYHYLAKIIAERGDEAGLLRTSKAFYNLVDSIEKNGINRPDLIAMLPVFVDDESRGR